MSAHSVDTAIPAVERADHADPPGIRRPHGKAYTVDAVDRSHVGAKAAIGLMQFARVEEIKVVLRQRRGERVGIVELDLHAVFQRDQDALLCRRKFPVPFEDACGVDAL